MKFYFSQVNGIFEQYKMIFFGDDFVLEGLLCFKCFIYVEDFDVFCDEVWKYVYQFNIMIVGFYFFIFFEKMFGLLVDNIFMVEQVWQVLDYYKFGDMFCWSYVGFGVEVVDMVFGKYLVWFVDICDGIRILGVSFLLLFGMLWNCWSWVIVLEFFDSGNWMCIYFWWNILVFEEFSLILVFFMDLVMMDGGGMVNCWMF